MLPSRTVRVLAPWALAAALVACREPRPEFDPAVAQKQLAEAFEVPLGDVTVYTHGRDGDEPDSWLVEFRLPNVREFLQAKFTGVGGRWSLLAVRERSIESDPTLWVDVGVMLGEVRRAAAENALETMETMEDLAAAIEAHAVDQGNRYPVLDISSLEALLVRGGYIESWHHGVDAWGNPMLYHASPSGDAYILVSPGSDSEWDIPVDSYRERTDAGNMVYEGPTERPTADLVLATGTFVQSYEPGA